MEHEIRVFLSYSTEDKIVVERLEKILKQNGIVVLWTEKVIAGTKYRKQLKIFIEHAHIFMPVISEASLAKGWVNQEIGYALAQHIPVLPICIGDACPIGLLHEFHALKICDDEQKLSEMLCYNSFHTLLKKTRFPALYQRADMVEQRAKLMKRYSKNICTIGFYGIIRQKGGLSSFHIPTEQIKHQVWTDRYSPDIRSEYHKKVQLAERKALQQHANKKGCRLIIKPEYATDGRSFVAAAARLKTMIEFLESMTDEKVIIAIQKEDPTIESLTMVGDWFLAESVSFKYNDGFTNTFFTRNACEIKKRIHKFDQELNELLNKQGWTPSNSRVKAIEELKEILCRYEL